MADSDNFCLRFNMFENTVKESWNQLKNETDFCDITLACENNQIRTHKIIISSFSPVLRNIIKLNQNPHPFIYLRRVKYRDLQNLIDFMYQGEINIAEEDLSSFLEVAEDLKVLGLSEGSTKGHFTNREKSSQFPNKNIIQSPKRKITSKSEIKDTETTNDNDSMFSEVDEYFFNNDKQSIGYSESSSTGYQILAKKRNNDKDQKESIVSTLDEKQFICRKCSGQFLNPTALSRHNKKVHEGIQYPCDKCDLIAVAKSDLKRHIESVHEGVRLPCNQCEYTAKHKETLNLHIKKKHT